MADSSSSSTSSSVRKLLLGRQIGYEDGRLLFATGCASSIASNLRTLGRKIGTDNSREIYALNYCGIPSPPGIPTGCEEPTKKGNCPLCKTGRTPSGFRVVVFSNPNNAPLINGQCLSQTSSCIWSATSTASVGVVAVTMTLSDGGLIDGVLSTFINLEFRYGVNLQAYYRAVVPTNSYSCESDYSLTKVNLFTPNPSFPNSIGIYHDCCPCSEPAAGVCNLCDSVFPPGGFKLTIPNGGLSGDYCLAEGMMQEQFFGCNWGTIVHSSGLVLLYTIGSQESNRILTVIIGTIVTNFTPGLLKPTDLAIIGKYQTLIEQTQFACTNTTIILSRILLINNSFNLPPYVTIGANCCGCHEPACASGNNCTSFCNGPSVIQLCPNPLYDSSYCNYSARCIPHINEFSLLYNTGPNEWMSEPLSDGFRWELRLQIEESVVQYSAITGLTTRSTPYIAACGFFGSGALADTFAAYQGGFITVESLPGQSSCITRTTMTGGGRTFLSDDYDFAPASVTLTPYGCSGFSCAQTPAVCNYCFLNKFPYWPCSVPQVDCYYGGIISPDPPLLAYLRVTITNISGCECLDGYSFTLVPKCVFTGAWGQYCCNEDLDVYPCIEPGFAQAGCGDSTLPFDFASLSCDGGRWVFIAGSGTDSSKCILYAAPNIVMTQVSCNPFHLTAQTYVYRGTGTTSACPTSTNNTCCCGAVYPEFTSVVQIDITE